MVCDDNMMYVATNNVGCMYVWICWFHHRAAACDCRQKLADSANYDVTRTFQVKSLLKQARTPTKFFTILGYP